MTRMSLAAVLLALLLGCGSPQPPVAPPAAGPDTASVPPGEMRAILEGLQSSRPSTQYAALETLGRFPAVARTYRQHIERLGRESKDERVRRKAAELLASLGQ
jgi:hypothetical protein